MIDGRIMNLANIFDKSKVVKNNPILRYIDIEVYEFVDGFIQILMWSAGE